MTSVEWSVLPPPPLCPRPRPLGFPCISFPSHSLDMGWEYGTLRRTHFACKIFCDGAYQPFLPSKPLRQRVLPCIWRWLSLSGFIFSP